MWTGAGQVGQQPIISWDVACTVSIKSREPNGQVGLQNKRRVEQLAAVQSRVFTREQHIFYLSNEEITFTRPKKESSPTLSHYHSTERWSQRSRSRFKKTKEKLLLNPHSSVLMLTIPGINCEAVQIQSITKTGSSLHDAADWEQGRWQWT